MNDKSQFRAAIIIPSIAAFEGIFVVSAVILYRSGALREWGFLGDRAPGALAGWLSAGLFAACFVFYSRRLASVRQTMFRLDLLKILAILMALASGVLEEWSCRGILMNTMHNRGYSVLAQVAASALAFGLLHASWALFRGNWAVGLRATAVTSMLGGALAVVFLFSGRVLAPCIAAHIVINLLCEPGLILAALRGEMRLQGDTSRAAAMVE